MTHDSIKKLWLPVWTCLFLLGTLPVRAGIYRGPIDEKTFQELRKTLTGKTARLQEKIEQARQAGISTAYAEVSLITIQLFNELYAPWDFDHRQIIREVYRKQHWRSRHNPVSADALAFDELSDCLEIADRAIAELESQLQKRISLTPPPDFSA
ncbi:MAG: hypothetical protein D6820_13865, partial [Lentisphaerae bacterium]